MRASAEPERAVDALLAAGLIDESEAEWIRQRAGSAVPRKEAWRLAPTKAASGSTPSPGARIDPPAPRAEPSQDAPATLDPYESLARGVSRLLSAAAVTLRSLPWRRLVVRGVLGAFIVLVAVFWLVLAGLLLSSVPVIWRTGLLAVAGAILVLVADLRLRAAADNWGVAAAGVGTALLALAVAVADEPFGIIAASALAGAAVGYAAFAHAARSRVLAALPVLVLPWLVLRVAAATDLPPTPVLVAVTLLVIAVAASAAAPPIVAPPRRRYAWALSRPEAVVAAAFLVTLYLLPATVLALSDGGGGTTLGVALLVAMTFLLFGVRTRSYVAITAGVALVSSAPVLFLLVVLGPVGWLLAGAGLGALAVAAAARRSRRRAAVRSGTEPPAPRARGASP